jgi:pimeloyl-ACP methyl ester carboxylesterase
LAVRWAAFEPRVRTAVAIGPYAQLSSAVLNVRREYAPLVPKVCVQAGLKELPSLLKVEPGELDPINVLLRHPVPGLFVAGEDDQLTPPSEVKRLEDAAAAGSRFLVVSKATHEALPFFLKDLAGPMVEWLGRFSPTR